MTAAQAKLRGFHCPAVSKEEAEAGRTLYRGIVLARCECELSSDYAPNSHAVVRQAVWRALDDRGRTHKLRVEIVTAGRDRSAKVKRFDGEKWRFLHEIPSRFMASSCTPHELGAISEADPELTIDETQLLAEACFILDR